MRNIRFPNIDDKTEFHRIAQAKRRKKGCKQCDDYDTDKCNECDNNNRAVMIKMEPYISDRYDYYDQHLDCLSLIVISNKLKQNQKELLLNTFKSSEFDGIRKQIINNLPNTIKGICPFCMIGEPATLEHYLPKDSFPEYTLYSKNLIPCCHVCNSYKGTNYLNVSGARRFINYYIDDVENKAFLKSTMYMYSLKKFFAYIGNKRYDQVSAFDVRAWLASLKLSGCKNVSVRNQKNNITAFFNWLYNDGIIEKNPCATIRPIKVEQEEKNCFNSEEVDSIRSACANLRERAIVEVLLSSGLRVTELCNLKMSDVDFNSMTVHVKHGKGGKDRITFISPVAKKYVYLYLAQAKHKSEYVFTTNLDGKYTSDGIQRITRNLSKRCGFHVHPHRFRRTLASDLARKGMPIQEIQKLLGHTNLDTTRRYTDTKIEQVQASYRQYIA